MFPAVNLHGKAACFLAVLLLMIGSVSRAQTLIPTAAKPLASWGG